jgi:hypothetical protein
MKKLIILSLLLLSVFAISKGAEAAVLSLEPSGGSFGPNSIFKVKVMIYIPPEECINAAQVEVDFPDNLLEVDDFSPGDSIFSLWIEKPSDGDFVKINQTGKISFIGGLPGGYCGKAEEANLESGIRNNYLLGNIIFSVKKSTSSAEAAIGFSSLSQAFLNTGSGIPAKLSFQNAYLKIDKNLTKIQDEWQEELRLDKITPENFSLEIGRDEDIFGGNYFLAFSTVDKQTGIDHYEVLEMKPADFKAVDGERSFLQKIEDKAMRRPVNLSWEKAVSPYLLKDQTLKSIIKVKAVDKAGNERVVQYQNTVLKSAINKEIANVWMIWAEAAVIAVLALILSNLALKLRKKKNEKNKTK